MPKKVKTLKDKPIDMEGLIETKKIEVLAKPISMSKHSKKSGDIMINEYGDDKDSKFTPEMFMNKNKIGNNQSMDGVENNAEVAKGKEGIAVPLNPMIFRKLVETEFNDDELNITSQKIGGDQSMQGLETYAKNEAVKDNISKVKGANNALTNGEKDQAEYIIGRKLTNEEVIEGRVLPKVGKQPDNTEVILHDIKNTLKDFLNKPTENKLEKIKHFIEPDRHYQSDIMVETLPEKKGNQLRYFAEPNTSYQSNIMTETLPEIPSYFYDNDNDENEEKYQERYNYRQPPQSQRSDLYNDSYENQLRNLEYVRTRTRPYQPPVSSQHINEAAQSYNDMMRQRLVDYPGPSSSSSQYEADISLTEQIARERAPNLYYPANTEPSLDNSYNELATEALRIGLFSDSDVRKLTRAYRRQNILNKQILIDEFRQEISEFNPDERPLEVVPNGYNIQTRSTVITPPSSSSFQDFQGYNPSSVSRRSQEDQQLLNEHYDQQLRNEYFSRSLYDSSPSPPRRTTTSQLPKRSETNPKLRHRYYSIQAPLLPERTETDPRLRNEYYSIQKPDDTYFLDSLLQLAKLDNISMDSKEVNDYYNLWHNSNIKEKIELENYLNDKINEQIGTGEEEQKEQLIAPSHQMMSLGDMDSKFLSKTLKQPKQIFKIIKKNDSLRGPNVYNKSERARISKSLTDLKLDSKLKEGDTLDDKVKLIREHMANEYNKGVKKYPEPQEGYTFGYGKIKKNINEREDVPFGDLLIDDKKLKNKNILSLITHDRKKIAALPNQKISEELKEVIEDMIDGKKPNISSLTDDEKTYLSYVASRADINMSLPESTNRRPNSRPKKGTKKELMNKLKIFTGELDNGSDSHLVKGDLRELLKVIENKGYISNEQKNQLEELYDL